MTDPTPGPGGTPRLREEERIRAEYERRARELPPDLYAPWRSAVQFSLHGQQRALRHALEREGLLPLGARRILDIGCGRGQWLIDLETLGAQRGGLHGIDLLADRVEAARARLGGSSTADGSVEGSPDLRVGTATELPWPERTFDLVLQSTLFSSILDPGTLTRIASEMLRVLRPGGVVLSYDLAFRNPRNPAVRAVTRRDLHELFPGCSIRARRLTLAPPLARRVVPVSWTLGVLLESIGVFNTHLLAAIRRRPTSPAGSWSPDS